MENRYLFRGKTISGNWVHGLLANKDDKWYISNKAGAPFAYEIRPESICQCTGLRVAPLVGAWIEIPSQRRTLM